MIVFADCIAKGKTGEEIFVNDFLEFLGIKWRDVTGCQQYQIIDSDFLTTIGTYEIKTNYRDDRHIIIEEFTNFNTNLAPKSLGWFYKTKAELLVMISKKSRQMVLIPMTQKFKDHYAGISENFKLIPNDITIHNGSKWQSAFRRIPLDSIAGYYALFKKEPE